MEQKLTQYLKYLKQEERSISTIKQYRREIVNFLHFAQGKQISKETVLDYKNMLMKIFQPASVNTKLAALNGFFSFIGKNALKIRSLKIQRQAFCSKENELKKEEYIRLVKTARAHNNEKLALLLQTLCSTGIRVSELSAVTVEAVKQGRTVLHLKGKIRIILIGGKLRKELIKYCKKHRINSGRIFVTRGGKPLNRSNIWKMMKMLCDEANVNKSKVFPHNLRHLFARSFYDSEKDIAKLADILGHSNINTTRIYITSSGEEHVKCMDSLGLIVQ